MIIRVRRATGDELDAPLELLEEFLREGDTLPAMFSARFREAVESGDYEMLVAYLDNEEVGVVVLSYRLSISAGGQFASVEELYVRPDARRQGVGEALLEAVGGRCLERGISYVEVQAVDESARIFYAAAGYEVEDDVRVMSRSYPL